MTLPSAMPATEVVPPIVALSPPWMLMPGPRLPEMKQPRTAESDPEMTIPWLPAFVMTRSRTTAFDPMTRPGLSSWSPSRVTRPTVSAPSMVMSSPASNPVMDAMVAPTGSVPANSTLSASGVYEA
jgi:hypothetical protein